MDVITHKCPNCGGALTFDPGDQKFHCPFCLSIFTEAEVTAFEQKQKEAQLADGTAPENQSITDDTEPALKEAITEKTEEKAAQMDLFLCPNCGAEIVTDATTAATYCYFCHNPVVLSGRLSGEFYLTKFYLLQSKKKKQPLNFWNGHKKNGSYQETSSIKRKLKN